MWRSGLGKWRTSINTGFPRFIKALSILHPKSHRGLHALTQQSNVSIRPLQRCDLASHTKVKQQSETVDENGKEETQESLNLY